MSALQMLDVAIGIIFIYLLLSFISSAVNEIIESFLKKRASDLQRGIRELLQPVDDNEGGLLEKFYMHPLIYGLYVKPYNSKSTKNLPSYIPSRNFALAVMDLILPAQESNLSGSVGGGDVPKPGVSAPDATVASSELLQVIQGLPDSSDKRDLLRKFMEKGMASDNRIRSLQPLRAAVLKWDESKASRALLALIDAAGDDIDLARQNIENWYDTTMDRVSGWYRHRVQRILIGIGFATAFLMNADSIAIYKSLANDPPLRNALVSASQEYAKTANLQRDSARQTPEERVENNIKRLHELRLPIGWDWNKEDVRNKNYITHAALAIPDKTDIGAWIRKFFGWLITAMAISLGAPFWFDLLNKFMVIRSTVKPHEKSKEEGSEDRQKN
ncbi:MAG: hypothetical protein WKF97_22320 [Chitinophagaceae bacterium]